MKEINRRHVNTILEDIFRHNNLMNGRNKREFREKPEEHLYFRGESEYFPKRTPSLYLQDSLIEHGSEYYYRSLINELGRDDYEANTSLVRLISELQHYGAKTRMLDITKSPLIALYFAVEKDNEKPGYLYIYRTTESGEKFDTGHTIAIKCALNLIAPEVINDFLEACTKIKEKQGCKFEELIGKTQEEILFDYNDKMKKPISRFMELLNQTARVREKLQYPIKIFCDLNKAHVIIPSKSTDRIKQQQGAFIFPKYVNTKNKSNDRVREEIDNSIQELNAVLITKKNKKEERFSCIKIDNGYKKTIRDELAQLGITSGFIYPDIEHHSNSLLENR